MTSDEMTSLTDLTKEEIIAQWMGRLPEMYSILKGI